MSSCLKEPSSRLLGFSFRRRHEIGFESLRRLAQGEASVLRFFVLPSNSVRRLHDLLSSRNLTISLSSLSIMICSHGPLVVVAALSIFASTVQAFTVQFPTGSGYWVVSRSMASMMWHAYESCTHADLTALSPCRPATTISSTGPRTALILITSLSN